MEKREGIYYQICSQKKSLEGEVWIHYGIICYDESGGVLHKVEDITIEFKEAEELLTLLIDYEVEPCHLNDIVEDYLVR